MKSREDFADSVFRKSETVLRKRRQRRTALTAIPAAAFVIAAGLYVYGLAKPEPCFGGIHEQGLDEIQVGGLDTSSTELHSYGGTGGPTLASYILVESKDGSRFLLYQPQSRERMVAYLGALKTQPVQDTSGDIQPDLSILIFDGESHRSEFWRFAGETHLCRPDGGWEEVTRPPGQTIREFLQELKEEEG